MRKIIFESALSVDGFIEGPNGEVDWWAFDRQYCNVAAFLSRFDTIFYGRKAYEKFATSCNTDQLTETQRQFIEAVRNMRKFVFSRVKKHVAGNGMVVSENIEEEVKRIREEEGKNIWFCGGAEIFSSFAELDLIDEFVFVIHPVMLRSGKLLFEGINKPLNLELLDKRDLSSGVVKLHYRAQNRIINNLFSDGRSF